MVFESIIDPDSYHKSFLPNVSKFLLMSAESSLCMIYHKPILSLFVRAKFEKNVNVSFERK